MVRGTFAPDPCSLVIAPWPMQGLWKKDQGPRTIGREQERMQRGKYVPHACFVKKDQVKRVTLARYVDDMDGAHLIGPVTCFATEGSV